MICERFSEEYEKVPVKNITADFEHSQSIVLFVEFEDTFVKNVTDCYAIAIAISKDSEFRLFLYEKGESFDGNETYYVGEFTKDDKHINYGTTSAKRVSLFSGKIMEILNKKE